MFRPSTGPGAPALKQLGCRREFDRVRSLFGENDRALLVAVVLRNMSLTRAAELLAVSKPRMTETLVKALDKLVEHFEIGEDRRRAA
jgi:hypothetical protein